MKYKITLLVALIAAFGLTGAAQKRITKAAVAPTYQGSPQTDKKAFKAFIIKNVGKRVYLKLTFAEEDVPYGYREENGDPVFSVDNYSYFPICDDKEANAEWTARCKKLNWNADSRTLTGYFKVTEPDPKVMRTNRTFHLTPTK